MQEYRILLKHRNLAKHVSLKQKAQNVLNKYITRIKTKKNKIIYNKICTFFNNKIIKRGEQKKLT